jgi:hypothetical protein
MSNAIIGALRVVLGMDSAAFDKGATAAQKRMKKMERALGRTSRKMKSIGKAMSVAITGPLIGVAYKSVAAQKAQERAVVSVEAALRSMGDGAGYTSKQLQKMASQLQSKSLYGDEEILSKVTANLLTFGNVSDDVFARAQQSALDMSARLGQDLQSSAVMLGKALNDPVKGLTALTRVGVSFEEQQKKQIKAMVEAGNVAGAQSLMLDELEKQYKGQAAALAGTDSGRVTQAWNAIGDALESVGAIILPIIADFADKVKEVAEQFQQLDPKTQEFIVKGAALAAVIGPLVVTLGLFVGALAPIAAVVAAIVSPVGLVVIAIGALGVAIYKNWDTIKEWSSNVKQTISDAVQGMKDAFTGAVDDLVGAIQDIWAGIWTEVSGWPAKLMDIGGQMIDALWDGITGRSAKTKQMMKQVGKDITGGLAAGVLQGKGDAASAMAEVSDYLDSVTRKQNEVQSPSRRYMRIGRMLMDGLGIGVRGGAASVAQDMREAAEGIAASMSSGVGDPLGMEGTEVAIGRVGSAADGVFGRMGTWLGKMIKGTTTLRSTLSDMMGSWSQSLAQSGFDGISGVLGEKFGKNSGGFLSGILGSLMGFANGGSFDVGGTGGIDSQLVAFRASPDENVTITKPGQVAGAGSGAAGAGNATVRVLGGELSLTDDGKIMARMQVMADNAVSRSVAAVSAGMKSSKSFGQPA